MCPIDYYEIVLENREIMNPPAAAEKATCSWMRIPTYEVFDNMANIMITHLTYEGTAKVNALALEGTNYHDSVDHLVKLSTQILFHE
jgi:hypothetical protein